MSELQIEPIVSAIAKEFDDQPVQDPFRPEIFLLQGQSFEFFDYSNLNSWNRFNYIAEVFATHDGECSWHNCFRAGYGFPRSKVFPDYSTFRISNTPEFDPGFFSRVLDTVVQAVSGQFGLVIKKSDMFVAGGSLFSTLRKKRRRDIDIFFSDARTARNLAYQAFLPPKTGSNVALSNLTPFAVSFQISLPGSDAPETVQLCFRNPCSPAATIAGFDFAHTQIFWTEQYGLETLTEGHIRYFEQEKTRAHPGLIVSDLLQPEKARFSLSRARRFMSENDFSMSGYQMAKLTAIFARNARNMPKEEFETILALVGQDKAEKQNLEEQEFPDLESGGY